MKLKFDVRGMTCAACSARVEKVAAAVPGVRKAEVNLLRGSLQVEAETEQVTQQIIRDIQSAGYEASLQGQKTPEPIGDTALAGMKKRICGSAISLIV